MATAAISAGTEGVMRNGIAGLKRSWLIWIPKTAKYLWKPDGASKKAGIIDLPRKAEKDPEKMIMKIKTAPEKNKRTKSLSVSL